MPPRLLIPTCMEFDSFLFSSVGTDRDKVDAKGLKLIIIMYSVLRTYVCMYIHMYPYAQYFIYG